MKSLSMMPKSVKIEYCKKMGVILPEMRNRMKVEREIRELQRTTNMLIPSGVFNKCVREVINEYTTKLFRIEKDANLALQQAAESFLVSLFQEADMMARHCKRVTILEKDMLLAMRLKSI
ncbi:hypothetical protein ENUP19_0009G0002 [Entamoeba nuttalli]|uniref:Histone H3, putative n=2 Tax=Entamoeba nuttalli TaxID=412467 RepID=K2H7I6_ENTNP|nr:histone H3, putative [Entamoeba nuttalli P19]EKE42547.1 histone H3, putative [Entamoeba nuttalli P19]|eukprot:XP_008855127.1 histone H3, putative [Entamoeba nuttalli P19]